MCKAIYFATGGVTAMGILSSTFFFILAISLLIAIHEFGHFWVARKLGVKVLRYSIGFGRPVWKRKFGIDQTEFVVGSLPLGGYVRMLDEREEPVAEHERHRAFNRQTVGKRIAIVTAGPLFNFLLAVVAYWLVFVIGVSALKPIVGDVVPDSPAERGGFAAGDVITRVDGERADNWQGVAMLLLDKSLDEKQVDIKVQDSAGVERRRMLDVHAVQQELKQGNLLDLLGIQPWHPKILPVIGGLEPGGSAEIAGLKVGDRIISCDGQPMLDWQEWVDCVRIHPEQVVAVEVERDGRQLLIPLQPRRVHGKDGDHGYVGASVALPQEGDSELLTLTRYSPLEALPMALTKTWDMSVLTLRMLWGMVSGQVSVSNISGPISIAKYAGVSAQVGGVAFLTFLAVVSLSLGVLNLLPVPVLDGGHLLYYLIELVKGSPVSETAQAVGQRIGIVLLILLMAVAVYNDLTHIAE